MLGGQENSRFYIDLRKQAPWSLRIQYINSRYEVVITQGKF